MPKVAPDVVAPPAGSLDLSPNRAYKQDFWPENHLDSPEEDFTWASPSDKDNWFRRFPRYLLDECNDPNVFKHTWWKKEKLAEAMEKMWDAIHVGDKNCNDKKASERDFPLNKKEIWTAKREFDYADKDALVSKLKPIVEEAADAMGHTDGGAFLVGELPAFLDEWRQVHKKVHQKEDKLYVPERCNREGFVASPHHLVFGLLLGDALKLHAFYGALFNPTGGVVGNGNSQMWPCLFLNPRLQVHGVTHDAAGHLLNFHHRGPGYPYLGYECCTGLCPDSAAFYANACSFGLCQLPCIHRANHRKSIKRSVPLSGQSPGHLFWMLHNPSCGGYTGGGTGLVSVCGHGCRCCPCLTCLDNSPLLHFCPSTFYSYFLCIPIPVCPCLFMCNNLPVPEGAEWYSPWVPKKPAPQVMAR